MTEATQTAVALFPIPNLVSFPGVSLPLHVFEPRYRAMVNHCLNESMMIAVAHTKKQVSKKQKKRKLADELNQNQSTYEPYEVFSAGHCKLIKTTEDGRIHLIVKPVVRLQLLEITQQVPFLIATCSELADEKINDHQLCIDRMSEINQLIQAISKQQSPEVYDILIQPEWLNLTPSEFSFRIFKYFRFEAEFMQHVLSQKTVIQRLDLIWHGLNQSLSL